MLQKLVYYCQAWCLGIYKTVFIHDSFKDYANGPVNKRLFGTHRFRRIVRKSNYPLTHIFSESEKQHMDHVICTYGNEDGDTLREYTHREMLWRETRGSLKDGERNDKDIAESLMMEYYHIISRLYSKYIDERKAAYPTGYAVFRDFTKITL